MKTIPTNGPRFSILGAFKIEENPMKSKFCSGRFLFTLVAAGVFGYTSVVGLMPMDDVKLILGIVITFYFTKPREPHHAT